MTAFEVRKDNLREHRFVSSDPRALLDGEVRFEIDRFALTANNITYAAFGEMMKYWNFFPAADAEWGRIPVWGFANVVESMAEGVEVGERYWGYYPMASDLIVEADGVRPDSFVDGASHREGLADVYNRYVRVGGDPGYRADFEDQQMLFRPLFTTSFLLDQHVSQSLNSSGKTRIMLSSASSKTSLGLAWFLSQRENVEVIGTTSPGNRAFVKNTQVYDEIIPYAEIANQKPLNAHIFVDMAGNPTVRLDIHKAADGILQQSVVVGATDWEATTSANQPGEELPGPAPEFFFAPDHVARLLKEWGGEEFNRRLTTAQNAFYDPAARWIKSVRHQGETDLIPIYETVLEGKVLPSEGHILSLTAS